MNSAHSTIVPDDDTICLPIGHIQQSFGETSKPEQIPLSQPHPEPIVATVKPERLPKNQVAPTIKKPNLQPSAKAIGIKLSLTDAHFKDPSLGRRSVLKAHMGNPQAPDVSGKIIHRVNINTIRPKVLGRTSSRTFTQGNETSVPHELELPKLAGSIGQPWSFKESLNQVLFSKELDLTATMNSMIQGDPKSSHAIEFAIELNNKLTITCLSRPVNLTAPETYFDNQREEMLQKTVFRRAKTLAVDVLPSARPLLQSTESVFELQNNRTTKSTSSRFVNVETFLELIIDGKVVQSTQLLILENPSVMSRPEGLKLIGGLSKITKLCFCFKKQTVTNFVLSFGSTQLTPCKPAIAFTLRAQHRLLEKYSYLDFKLQERMLHHGVLMSEFTIAGSSVHFARKHSAKKPSKPEEFFEFVGQVMFSKLELRDQLSILSDKVAITHTVQVFLSDWPLTFGYLVGEISIEITRLANGDQTLDNLDMALENAFVSPDLEHPTVTFKL